jgi:hypothetical protein
LRESHVRIKGTEDELVWSRNPIGGVYTPKLGYKVLEEGEGIKELEWWFKEVWNFKFPL